MHDNASNEPSTPLVRVIDQLADIAIAIAGSALLGLVLVQGWQVIARYVLNDSPSWTEPVTLLLLSTAMSFSAAAGVRTRRHFSFALLADAVGPGLRRALHGLQSLTVLLIGTMLTYWGTLLFFDGLHIPTAGIAMPESIDYLPIALGGALMVIFALAQLLPGADAAAPAVLATAETD